MEWHDLPLPLPERKSELDFELELELLDELGVVDDWLPGKAVKPC